MALSAGPRHPGPGQRGGGPGPWGQPGPAPRGPAESGPDRTVVGHFLRRADPRPNASSDSQVTGGGDFLIAAVFHRSAELQSTKGFLFVFVTCSKLEREVLVQGTMVLDGVEQPCAAPFSWLIKSYLQSLWDESEFIPGLLRIDCL